MRLSWALGHYVPPEELKRALAPIGDLWSWRDVLPHSSTRYATIQGFVDNGGESGLRHWHAINSELESDSMWFALVSTFIKTCTDNCVCVCVVPQFVCPKVVFSILSMRIITCLHLVYIPQSLLGVDTALASLQQLSLYPSQYSWCQLLAPVSVGDV